MTLQELIKRLQALYECFGDNCDVRIVINPQWPFEHNIESVTLEDTNERPRIYLVQGQMVGDVPQHVQNQLGW